MEPVKYQRRVPSVHLLNEIDILLTQVRLVELYLNQTHAAAADHVARIQERYESELENLRALIRQKERSFDESPARTAATETLNLQIQDLQAHLEEHRRLLEQRDGDLQRVTAELVTSRSQITQLQLANDEAVTAAHDAERVRQELQTDLGKLRDEIGQKTRELRQHRSAAQQSEQCLQDQLGRLKDELAQAQDLVSAKGNDLQQTRAGFEARLAELETTVAQKDLALQERDATVAAVERDLQAKIHDLGSQLAQKQDLLAGQRAHLADGQRSLEQRTGELQEARSEIAALGERAEQLDLLQKQTERLLAVQAEQIRQRVRAELQDLDSRLASKDGELQAVRESAVELQASLNATIGGLRLELAEKLELAQGRDAELLSLREELRGKHQALAEKEARATELERRLGTHISDLETELAAKQRLLEEREEALNTANSSAVALQERYTRLEASGRDEQITLRYEAQMAALHIEIEQKTVALEENSAARNDLVRTYRAELSRLQAESQEKHLLLESRNEEFVVVKNTMESLRERLTQPEATAAQAQQAAAEDRERLRAEYEAQLAALREELSERERSDKEQDAVETAPTKPGQTLYSRGDRRWRSSGGWKRRWKI